MNATEISLAAARRLRNGRLPHIPPPAAPVSSPTRLVLEAPPESRPEAVLTDTGRGANWRIALQEDNQDAGIWTAELLLPREPTVVTYYFELADGQHIRERRQVEGTNVPIYGVWEEKDFRIAVYSLQSTSPEWARGGVTYQIFPDRFARGNPQPQPVDSVVYGRRSRNLSWHEKPELPPQGRDFYGGTIRGITENLDYLADLGVSHLYLTPIFTSPTNHRYDVLDYFQIDPRLGDERDLRALVEAATARNIRVMLDGVFNHCSRDNPFFKAAQGDRCSPYYRWFAFDDWPDGYTGWAGVADMPQFVECPEVEEFFFGPDGVARHWLRAGIAGWRLDVVPWKSDEFWRRLRAAVDRERDDVY
ncbi:MAG: alpha-amylase family glycosyl hydrolase, partial [Anaerolineae bacterium]|nr:alpha-amylase family glycosyl hydrolase [Anaerolineae bacterium]